MFQLAPRHLIELVEKLQGVEDVYLAQALLSPENGVWSHAALTQGFHQVAKVDLFAALPRVQSNHEQVELQPMTDAKVFQTLISETFRDSLDCQPLNDPRASADLLEEYRSRCHDDQTHWYLAVHEEQTVGCIILNVGTGPPLPMEIVYFGVLPEFRGRGLGAEMLQRVREIAARQARMISALVDVANLHAIRTYEQTGFVAVESRRLYIKRFDRSV